MDVTRPLIIAGLLLALASCSSSSTDQELSESEKKSEIYFNQGTQELQEGRYTDALGNLLKAHGYKPDSSTVNNNLGMAYFFKGKKDKAIEHLEKSISLDPKNSDAKNNLASIMYHKGNFKRAKELYLEVSEDLVYKLQFRVKYNLALIAVKEGRNGEASKLLNESLEANKDYCPAHFLLGKIEASQGRNEKAMQHLSEAASGTCTSSPAPLMAHAKLLEKSHDYEKARLKYREIRDRFPASEEATVANQRLKEIALEERRGGTSYSAAQPDDVETAPQF